MGCDESVVREDGSPVTEAAPREVADKDAPTTTSTLSSRSGGKNAPPIPKVPADSWYNNKFTEPTLMQMCELQQRNKGRVLMANHLLPSTREQMVSFPGGLAGGNVGKTRFILGDEPIYGMGYFHNTALYIEHQWRPRVAFRPEIKSRFERPFYNMLLGVKIIIDGVRIPDVAPFADSLENCSATIAAHEATTTWLCMPLVLYGDVSHRLISKVWLYRGMMLSFLTAARALTVGDHEVRIDCVYGCRDENFLTDFISLGTFTLEVTPESRRATQSTINSLKELIRLEHDTLSNDGNGSGSTAPEEGGIIGMPPMYVPNDTDKTPSTCSECERPRQYICTTCGAAICGSPECVWATVKGYPTGCRSHRAVI